MNPRPVLAFAAVLSMVALAFGTTSVAAVERSSGDFWTYDITLNVEGFNVNGTITYEFVGTDSVTLNGTSYDVNVMSISGGAVQSVSFFDFEVSAALGGTVLETKDKMALVKDDLFMWINMTLGSGTFQLVTRMKTEINTTYSPPLLSGFDPGKTKPGDSWTETVSATTTTTEWENGTMVGAPEISTDSTAFDFSVDSAMQSVTTPAGKFDCLKITAVGAGDTVVYFWSDKAGNYVKEDSYQGGSSTPFSSMTLKDYRSSSGVAMITFIAVGGVVLVVALVVLALVVIKKKKQVSYPPPPQSPPAQ